MQIRSNGRRFPISIVAASAPLSECNRQRGLVGGTMGGNSPKARVIAALRVRHDTSGHVARKRKETLSFKMRPFSIGDAKYR